MCEVSEVKKVNTKPADTVSSTFRHGQWTNSRMGFFLAEMRLPCIVPGKGRTDRRFGTLKEPEQSLMEACLPRLSRGWSWIAAGGG